MPHDSIQILLVVKPSQKDRENLGTAVITIALSEHPYIQDVPEKFVHPSCTVSINNVPQTKTIKHKRCFYWRSTIRKIVFVLFPVSDVRHWLRKNSNVTFCSILFRPKVATQKTIILNKNIPPEEIIWEKLFLFPLSKIMCMVFKVFIRQIGKLEFFPETVLPK
jgi:hypothetical protein